jgi:hypothetical protein
MELMETKAGDCSQPGATLLLIFEEKIRKIRM